MAARPAAVDLQTRALSGLRGSLVIGLLTTLPNVRARVFLLDSEMYKDQRL